MDGSEDVQSGLELLFTVDNRYHGRGDPIIFQCNNNSPAYVASCGNSRVVHIFDKRGMLVTQISPPAARYGYFKVI